MKNKSSIGCLFWLALVLFIIVIFLFNQKNIEEIIRRTGFLDVFSSDGEPVEVIIVTEDTPPEDAEDIVEDITEDSSDDDHPDEISINIDDNTVENPDNNEPELNNTQEIVEPEKSNLRNAVLYFVRINAEGLISLAGTMRPVYYDDSPLRETLITLINGQSTSEISQGMITMIPEGTELRNVYVRENTAFIDFSDEFLINPLGHVGLIAQIEQVVYTSTEFKNINNVQILIEGKIQEYLSSEGFYLGEPLSRDSF